MNEEAQEVMTIIAKFKNHEIAEGGEEQYESRIKLIVEKKPVLESGCRLCPSCIRETPSIFSVCLYCSAILDSHGIRPFRMDFPAEEDEEETTKEEIDEQVRKLKEEMFKETIDKAKEQQDKSETQSQFDFDMSEVDFDDDADQEMENEDEENVEEDEDMDPEVTESHEKAKSENDSIPLWAKKLETDLKKMPALGLINIDMSEGASQIFDNALTNLVIALFKFYSQ